MNLHEQMYEQAKKVVIHGIVRYFDPYPLYLSHGKGSRLYGVDGKEYVDYYMGMGACILGHAHPKITGAVEESLEKGTNIFFPTEVEIEVAAKLVKHLPGVERARFVCSGTEACMHAVRLARAFTGKDRIVKIEGAFHGDFDALHISYQPPFEKAGPETSPTPVASTGGIPDFNLKNIIVSQWNDLDSFEKTVRTQGKDIAALIIEPVILNKGIIMPEEGYLQGLRELTEENNILLIFDEVATFPWLGLGGAQKFFDVIPDIVTLAKSLGGGLPMGAIGGKKEIMELLLPPNPKVIIGSTFHSHFTCLTASLACLQELENEELYNQMRRLASQITEELGDAINRLNLRAQVLTIGSIFTMYLTDHEIRNYRDLIHVDKKAFWVFQKEMMKNGILWPQDAWKRCHVSASHTEDDVSKTIDSAEVALSRIR